MAAKPPLAQNWTSIICLLIPVCHTVLQIRNACDATQIYPNDFSKLETTNTNQKNTQKGHFRVYFGSVCCIPPLPISHTDQNGLSQIKCILKNATSKSFPVISSIKFQASECFPPSQVWMTPFDKTQLDSYTAVPPLPPRPPPRLLHPLQLCDSLNPWIPQSSHFSSCLFKPPHFILLNIIQCHISEGMPKLPISIILTNTHKFFFSRPSLERDRIGS